MSLASELSGDSALARIQDRVTAYWDRQIEKRVISTLLGVLASNVANNASDMVVIDADVAKPNRPDGRTAFTELCKQEKIDLSSACVVTTPRRNQAAHH